MLSVYSGRMRTAASHRTKLLLLAAVLFGSFALAPDAKPLQAAPACLPLGHMQVEIKTPFPSAQVDLVDQATLAAEARNAALPGAAKQPGIGGPSGGPLWHRVGLWLGTLEMSYDYRMLVSGAGSKPACAQIQSARLIVGFVSNRILISQGIADNPCRYDVTLAHERQHAEVARQTLAAHAALLEAEIVPRLRSASAATDRTVDGATDAIAVRWKEIMDGFFKRLRLEHARAQATLDTPEEYRRLQALCR